MHSSFCYISIMQTMFFLLPIAASQGASILVPSLLMKTRKQLGGDVLDTLPHRPAVFMASPIQTAGHSHGHVFATVKRRFLTNGTRNRGGGGGQILYVFLYTFIMTIFSFSSIPVDSAHP